MTRFLVPAFAVSFLLAASAEAQMMGVGPGGHGNYLNVHGEFASRLPGLAFQVPSGVSIDWGAFQSKYVGGGSRIGLSRLPPGLNAGSPWVLFFGGGGQFHIPLGDQASLIPSFNLGYRIGSGIGGLAVTGGLAGVANVDRFYFGLEAETYLFAQGVGSEIFPGTLTVNGLFGLYY